MQLHQIKPRHKTKKKKRVGRGGKKGTYSGRGLKGQKARAGKRMQPVIRGWLKRYPKLKGYRYSGKKRPVATLGLDVLEKKFKLNEIVSPKILVKKGIIHRVKGRVPLVKILVKGKLTKRLIFHNCLFSKNALEKIKSLGSRYD